MLLSPHQPWPGEGIIFINNADSKGDAGQYPMNLIIQAVFLNAKKNP